MFHRHARNELTWRELVSPRAMVQFTLGDAWGSLPTTLAMAGFFLGAVLMLFLVKKLLQVILLRKEVSGRWVLIQHNEATHQDRWRREPVHRYGTLVHLALETLFFFGIGVAGLFAASVGDINIWATSIGSVGIGIIGTYVFGSGLQQVGSGYFMLLSNMISVGEYWEVCGRPGVEGFVTRITPTFIELEKRDEETNTARLVRIPAAQIVSGIMCRNYSKEADEQRVFTEDGELPSSSSSSSSYSSYTLLRNRKKTGGGAESLI